MTKGRTEPCKDNLGGIKAVYIGNFVGYTYSQFTFDTIAELTNIPTTTVYKFPLIGNSSLFTDTSDSNKHDQKLFLSLPKQSIEDGATMKELVEGEFRIVVEMQNGKFKVMGLENGCSVESMTATTGGSYQDFSGYNITFNAEERFEAPFIADLAGVGFKFVETLRFQDLVKFLFQDNVNFDVQ